MLARVYVTCRKEVLDPQGKTVMEALRQFGFGSVSDVRQGKYFEISIDSESAEEAQMEIQEMCKKLLANPVIENYRFELSD